MNWARHVTLLALSAGLIWGQPEVVATGLQGPQKMVMTPGGNFLVTETNVNPNSGRVSFVTRGGTKRSLFDKLPSGTEVTGGGGGPTAMALYGRTLYLTIGGVELERRGTTPGTSMHNPAGLSSPIFASLLKIDFNTDVDTLGGTFVMTPAQQVQLSDHKPVAMDDGAGGTATVNMLVDFPNSIPDANTIYRFSNPWGLAVSGDGKTVYATDASMNALMQVDTATGQWQRIVKFPPLPNIGGLGPPMLDAVPTSVRVYGNQLLVSFLTGFPFYPGYARVLAVNPGPGTTEPFIFGISSTTDVLWRPVSGGASQFFTLEFSQNQSATPPPPGRLLRFATSAPEVVSAQLITPVSMAWDEQTKEMFVLELRGQIVKLKLQ